MNSRYPSPVRIAAAVLLLGGGASSSAQTAAEPADLTALRKNLEWQASTASQQLNELYARALAKLEAEFAAAGEFEEAIAARDRRREIEALQAARPPAAAISLAAKTARTTGSVAIENDALTGWKTKSSSAEWSVPSITPGKYRIELSAHLSKPLLFPLPAQNSRDEPVKEAAFRFSEVSLLAGAAANNRDIMLREAEEPGAFTTLATAPITIARSSLVLRLEPSQGFPANVISIRDVRLIPEPQADGAAASPSPPARPASSAAMQIDELQSKLESSMAAIRQSEGAAYLAQLQNFTSRTSGAGSREIAAWIAEERKRANALMLETGIRSSKHGLSSSTVLDGYEEISPAYLVDEPSSDGDRFAVLHEGRQIRIRLAWVRCPPAADSAKEALKPVARRFGISEADAQAVGRLAGEFTKSYLSGRELRLLARKSGDADSEREALVFLDDVGLFQAVLIDHGLAAFMKPEGGRTPLQESSLMRMIEDRERKAAGRQPPPGAWAFRDPAADIR